MDRAKEIRTRLNLPTPCPACSDPASKSYCSSCIKAVADYMDMDIEEVQEVRRIHVHDSQQGYQN